jgi:hypothetical protein
LLAHEEKPALDDGETAAGKSRSAHELDHVIRRECITPNCFGNEWKTVRLGFYTLLTNGFEEDFCLVCVLEDYTSISFPFIFVDTKADTVL